MDNNSNKLLGGERNQASILTWNINHGSNCVGEKKIDDTDFAKVLKSSEIFCLQETKQSIKLEDYDCFDSLRKNSRSGGLCTGIHHSLKLSYIFTPLATGSEDIQAIKSQMYP